MTISLADLQALTIDMDGVLYRGNTALPGAARFLEWLAERGFPYLLLTNNSSLDAEAYEAKLAGLGMAVPASRILTSAEATADYIAHNFSPRSRVLIVGGAGLERSIARRGFVISAERPEIVAVGLDRGLTYDKLTVATLAIRAGAAFVASNPDLTYPIEQGEAPGAGAIVAALEASTGQAPVMIGKPERPIMDLALSRLGTPRGLTAMLGDRLETDVLGGRNAGMPAILVLTGITRAAPPPGDPLAPDWVFDNLDGLREAWEEKP